MAAIRMPSLIKRVLAIEIDKNLDTNPLIVPPEESVGETADNLFKLAQGQVILKKDGSPLTQEDAQRIVVGLQHEFAYRKDKSFLLIDLGVIISRYFCPGLAVAGRPGHHSFRLGYNAYRVEGNDKTFPTLREALAAAGFDLESYLALP